MPIFENFMCEYCIYNMFILPFPQTPVFPLNYSLFISSLLLSHTVIHICAALSTHTSPCVDMKTLPCCRCPVLRLSSSHPLSHHVLCDLGIGVPHSQLFSEFWPVVVFYDGVYLLRKRFLRWGVRATCIWESPRVSRATGAS